MKKINAEKVKKLIEELSEELDCFKYEIIDALYGDDVINEDQADLLED